MMDLLLQEKKYLNWRYSDRFLFYVKQICQWGKTLPARLHFFNPFPCRKNCQQSISIRAASCFASPCKVFGLKYCANSMRAASICSSWCCNSEILIDKCSTRPPALEAVRPPDWSRVRKPFALASASKIRDGSFQSQFFSAASNHRPGLPDAPI